MVEWLNTLYILHNVIMRNIIWVNQKTDSLVFRWLCTHAMLDVSCFSKLDVFLSIRSIRLFWRKSVDRSGMKFYGNVWCLWVSWMYGQTTKCKDTSKKPACHRNGRKNMSLSSNLSVFKMANISGRIFIIIWMVSNLYLMTS